MEREMVVGGGWWMVVDGGGGGRVWASNRQVMKGVSRVKGRIWDM